MDAAAKELRKAAQAGDVERAQRLLAAAPDPAALVAAVDEYQRNALHRVLSSHNGVNLELVSLLVAVCPSAAAANDGFGYTALHWAADCVDVEAVRLLLKVMPAALVTGTGSWKGRRLPLHVAAQHGHAAVVQLLLEAAPLTAAAEEEHGWTPLDECCLGLWSGHCDSIARLLIAAPGQQPARLLQSLTKGLPATLPLFADVASRYPLSPADWHLVPLPCPGLAAALSNALERSTAEAALLVAHLPDAERRRLRTAALALHRTEVVAELSLPQPLVWRILANCLD